MGVFAESRKREAWRGTDSQSPGPTHSRSRSRSKCPMRQARRHRSRDNWCRSGFRRSRSAARSGGSSRSCGKDTKNKSLCWFGQDCRRRSCWYSHPEGRSIDKGHLRRGRLARSPSSESFSPSDSTKQVELDSGAQGDIDSMRSTTAITPIWLSFRDFILQQIDDSHSLAEALSKYEAFEKAMLLKTMEGLRSSGLLDDLYNPIATIKQKELFVTSGCSRAKLFVVDVEKERFAGLSHLLATNRTVSSNGTHSVGHLQAPSFAFDPSANAIAISKIVPAISVWEICEILWKQPGFLSASKPRFSDDRLTRTYYARFETTSDAKAALKVLSAFTSKGSDEKKHTELPCFELSASAESLEAFVLPPVMSSADRIQKDFDFTTEIVCKLDDFLGVPADVTNALLGASGSTEMKLDLQVMYLRRVHCFCFYSCAWCDDEWDLRDRCGAAFLRSDPSTLDDAAKAAGSKWAETHEARIQEFLATASFQKASLPSVEDEPFYSYVMAEVDSKIIKHPQDKYQCAVCGKCFREKRYAEKHLRKTHVEIQDIALHKASTEIAASAYLADPRRPGWPPVRQEMFGLSECGA